MLGFPLCAGLWLSLCTGQLHLSRGSACLSSQVKDQGYEIEHGGYCITVFSAPNYCDQMGNKGAFIRFRGDDMSPQFTTFEAVPHPPVRVMAYANQFMGSMFGF